MLLEGWRSGRRTGRQAWALGWYRVLIPAHDDFFVRARVSLIRFNHGVGSLYHSVLFNDIAQHVAARVRVYTRYEVQSVAA